MDIRKPPKETGKSVQCDATEITLPDESFDAVSTACVLTHAGTGRYGDSLKQEHGDELMLGHISRVMKSGSMAAITFGAVADIPKMKRLGSAHRVYTVAECERMIEAVKLKVGNMKIWSWKTKDWTDKPTTSIENPDYISFMVTK